MNDVAVVDLSRLRGRKACAAGRRAAPSIRQALAEVRALLGDAPRRRDLLIEYLHRIQDRFGHISAAHIVALAQEMKLAMTEVYEVATFYHHFDVVKEGETPPPPITVRVCETLSCEMAGADALRDALPRRCGGRTCACSPRRASAAASTRPPRSSAGTIDRGDGRAGRRRGRRRQARERRRSASASTTPLSRRRRLHALRRLRQRRAQRRRRHRRDGKLGAARAGRRGISDRPQVEDRARRAGAAPDGGQHRRRRAGHVQGSLLPRARSAPLSRRHADRGLGGRHRRRSTSICATNTRLPRHPDARDRGARRPIRRARCRRSICGAAPARTSAAKSRR